MGEQLALFLPLLLHKGNEMLLVVLHELWQVHILEGGMAFPFFLPLLFFSYYFVSCNSLYEPVVTVPP